MNKLHGSPYDRGSADAYYRRPISISRDLTKEQEMEYLKGYWDQQKSGDFKDYGDNN
jgi:hypothetical protein